MGVATRGRDAARWGQSTTNCSRAARQGVEGVHRGDRKSMRKLTRVSADRSGSRGGVVILTILLCAAASALAVEDVPGKRRSPVERMAPARLMATHEHAVKIRATRHDLPEMPGVHDFRAILHAHAEDSAHTGGTRPEMLAEARR